MISWKIFKKMVIWLVYSYCYITWVVSRRSNGISNGGFQAGMEYQMVGFIVIWSILGFSDLCKWILRVMGSNGFEWDNGRSWYVMGYLGILT